MTAIEQQKTYWREQLAGLPPPPQLPLASERPPVSSFVRETVEAYVEPEIWFWARQLALKSGTTPQAALATALYVLFFRYSGQTDLSLGTIVENSDEPGQGDLIALRMRLEETGTARELMQRVGAGLKQASEQTEVAFEIAAEAASHNGGITTSVFNTIISFSAANCNGTQSRITETVAAHRADEFALSTLVVRATEDQHDGLNLVYDYDAELLQAEPVKRLAGHVRMLLSSMAAEPDKALAELALLDNGELEQLLVNWNETATDYPLNARIHELFEAQVERTPDAVAAVWRNQQLTYRELNARANQLAAYLGKLNVGPDTLVGICVERSLEMLVGLLGILKSGGAYLPLDPAYPAERIAFMIQDARAGVLLTQELLAQSLPTGNEKVVRLDTDWPVIAAEDERNLNRPADSNSLAYVIYTSGSTGKPKGVMVEHRNVVNFFVGMDQRLNHEPGSTWLAVTSLSFDISVLELFWTLSRGFKVILYRGEDAISPRPASRAAARPIDFSLFYFSSDQTKGAGGAYRLLIEGAKFADEHGFTAVWTPERHFHEFGGLYPNPSVTSAALAMVTRQVQIRSGSVVAPLHSPIRIAEEWAVVDNLSNGRVAISFASGWMPEDFAIMPQNYAARKDIMFQDIDVVRQLWRGESVLMPGPLGKDVAIRVLPRPVQPELPVWVTAAGNPETFEMAGKLGANLLTHLLGQKIDEVAEKVAIYRKAWREAGHAGHGRVALMLHTFVGESVERVKATVRQPLIEYLRKSADLIRGYAWAFSAFKRQGNPSANIDFASLPKEEMDALLAHAFERYFETSGLFGTPETCMAMIDKLRAKGIDEVACLIDFGIDADLVLENLKHLALVQKAASQSLPTEQHEHSIPELIERHAVTHLQCTPSMARMLLLDDRSKEALGRLRTMLVGGEALPGSVAQELRDILPGDLINMYGPTETTVWSSTYSISRAGTRVTVGRPIANTQIFILDQHLQPVPVGLPGELMIGGAGVARGYLNRPELTAERFISNPFNHNGHSCIYRTGDLARFLSDGNIELLGRIDQQVKIRGHRIELGEIEATLNQHPMVREAVVVSKPGSAGDARLVAYVIPNEGQKPGASQLRGYIKDKLPDYMVPAHVVFMAAFPQTPNKKIDRKALPAPDISEPVDEAKIEAPISEVEKTLCEIYAEVLQVGRVGRNDDFFELGGDSLSAVQLLARIRQTCKVEFPLENLFDSPTVCGLAAKMEALVPAKAAAVDRISTCQAQVTSAKNGESKDSQQLLAACSGVSAERRIVPEYRRRSDETLLRLQPYEPPRTETEEKLAKIWAEALGIERVGRGDNFLALGGNSIVARKLLTGVESAFSVRLPLETLIDAPTLHQMAALLGTQAHPGSDAEADIAPPEKPASPAQSSCSIVRRQDPSECPLSSGQQRLWFLQHLEGGCHYDDHFNLRLTGGINVSALERSILEILRRHEAMRARFIEVDGQPVQRIEPLQNFSLTVIDLRELPLESRLPEATRLAVDEARKPFDLAAGPLWRFHLVVLANEDHLLLITAHHIAIDGWSRGVFLNEFCAIYKAFLLGRASPLSELPVQYSDYAARQSEWHKSAEFTRQLDFWKQRLAGAPPLLELPCDRPRPPIQSFRGARHYFKLPKTLTTDIRNLARHEKATLFMTLLAGFQSLLYRYTGQEDMLIGTPVASRPQKEIQGLIGYFLNTVVLRGDCSGAPTFRQLLKRVRATSLEAFGNQDLPLDKLTDALQLERNQSHSPLFQVLFVLQNVPAPEVDIPGLSVQPFEIDNGTAKFDLTVSLFETEDGLTGWLEYSTELFDGARMARMVGHFQTVLEAIAVDPDRRLQELPLLTDAERQQVLVDWNRTRIDYPKDRCLHELIEEQAERTPEAVAVVFEEARLTYRQLNERANQLAHHLQKLGVGPDVLVGICMERSLELVIGLLGILKAGGAYVPLDPAYPAERLGLVIEDARMGVLVSQGKCLEKLAKLPARALDLDRDRITIGTEVKENLPKACRPENLAYVIYTSGSTGRPKGVAIEHRSPVAFVAWAHTVFTAKELAGVLFSTSVCFDLSIFELFVPLAQGGSVILVENALELAALGPGNEVTLVNTVPSAIAELVRTQPLPASVVTVNLAGEPLAASLVDKIYEQGSVRKVYDLYGPSETTTYSTFTLRSRGGGATIGRPIANTQVYLLDRQLQPVPIGVPGELHIGGVGLARGYLNRPELTAEKFIPDPFGSEPGARLYKTGDLARYLSDGTIEYLGRIDHQVKVRGFRIELGEIESVLAAHPGLRENVVVVRQDRPDEKQLVAYVVATAQPAPEAVELRHYLLEKLPDYMVPSLFVLLPALPRLSNGKIDRKALPAPDMNRGGKVFDPPITVFQKALGEVWKGLLRVDQVGLYDNFFDLGGHSLLAMQLIARVRNALKVELTLQQFFAAPTLIEMSQAVESAQGRSESVKMAVPGTRTEGTSPRNESILPQATSPFLAAELTGVELDRDGIVRVFPVSFAQQRLWFLEQLEPNTAVYNVAYAFCWQGPLNLQAVRASLQSILDRHEPLRSVFATIGADAVQVIQRSCPLDVPLVDLSGLPAIDRKAEAQKLAEVDARRPFNLSRDLMLRAKVVRLDAEEHQLLITVHHIASDFWSVGVLFREFAAAYEKYLKGMDGSLPAPVVQYADFAVWQRDYLRGELLGKQLSYWKRQLAGAPPLLALPTDRPRPPLQTYAGAAASLHLSGELRDSLQELSRREGVTLFMTMLAAFEVLLHRYSGQDDIVVGSPIAGRNEVETEGLIGFFVNTIVLRTDLSGDPSFKGLLTRVRDTALGAYAYQDLPFEKLVEELQPERNLSYNPLCQVLFSFQNPAVPPLESAGVALSLEPVATGTSKMDLGLFITEQVDGVAIWAEYSTDLFASDTISRLLDQYKTMLESAVAHPDMPVSRLPLLPPDERRLILEEWNQTSIDYNSTKCVHEIVEEQAALFPDRIAVEFGELRMTYAELDRRATSLAAHLQSLGVGPDSLVCLCLERSLDLVVGALGVLKAGGAYVPLDPAYPTERLAFILADARAKALVTETALLHSLPLNLADSPPIICLEQLLKTAATDPAIRPLERAVRPENLAYVIYTSGSTGKPKGVQVEHRSVVNFLDSMRRKPGLTENDVLLAVTTFCFDIAGLELFLPLTTGARVVIASRDVTVDGVRLARLIKQSGATVMQATPATWRLLIEAGWKGNRKFKILCGGEAWTRDLAEALLERCGSLWNMYGPTETTIWSAVCEISHDQPVLIGPPIANTQFYVLDKSLQPVPIGVPGELHIAGDGVARGYANLPSLTTERFVADPFARNPAARMYKTGDLVRYHRDEMIEYLGRMDYQVKVRGFRIELGEIESALAAHPALRENVVIVRQDQPDDKQLIAYIVAAVEMPPVTSELRQYLLQKLPDYMVPSAFVLLPALPRLPNGKIDRKTLPAVSTKTATTATTDKIAPRDELEQRLARIWERVLSIRPIGVTDNFFDLGGHSLLAVRLFLETKKILNRDLPLATLFQAPTIEQIAQLLRNSGWVAPSRSLVPVQEQGDKPPFFCVHGGGGNVLLFRGLSRHLGPAFPFYALQSQGVDGKREFLTRVEDMAARYLLEIRDVQPEGPYYLGGFCMGGSIAYEMAQLLAQDGQEVALLALFDTYNHNGRSPDRSLSSSFSYARQKSRFHLTNLRALSGPERVFYLKTKFTDARQRAIGRAKVARTNLLNLIRLRKLERRSFIEDINDQAAIAYRPRPYHGKITLFKHLQNYSFFADPQMGWAGLPLEGLNVIEVPASPGGMFVEPYVQVLAARLKASLEAAQSGCPDCEWEHSGQVDTRDHQFAK